MHTVLSGVTSREGMPGPNLGGRPNCQQNQLCARVARGQAGWAAGWAVTWEPSLLSFPGDHNRQQLRALNGNQIHFMH